ncbi:hypothetical protein ACHAXR_000493 [Thalassiosira sp. AJA248-18]
MKDTPIVKDRPLPLPSTKDFMKEFVSAVGDPDPKVQPQLAKLMKASYHYHNLVGEMTYSMLTCRPDISFATVKCAQAIATPAEVYYPAATQPNTVFVISTLPGLTAYTSGVHNLWMTSPTPTKAACPKTHRSFFTGICLRLAGGGTLAYKTKFQPTVAMSSTESEFMAASGANKMLLYPRSILYDLLIPQENASLSSMPWRMLANPPLARDTLTSIVFWSAIGLNVT